MEAEDRIRVLTFSLRDSVVAKLDDLNTEGNRSAVVSGLIERAWEEHEYCECQESEPRPELNAVGRAEWRCAKCGGRAIGDDGEE